MQYAFNRILCSSNNKLTTAICNDVDGSLKHNIDQQTMHNHIYPMIPAMILKIVKTLLRFEVRIMITLGIRKCLVFGVNGVTMVIFSAGKVPVLYVRGGCTGTLTLKN